MQSNNIKNNELPLIKNPIRLAIIGAGNRSWTVYRLILPALKPWIKVVAVCDPVKEHANKLGAALDIPVFYNIQDLIASELMEATLISTPIESHYAYSMYCSAHGIHNMVETMFCNLVGQATNMVAAASANQVVVSMAENFFNFPVDRFAQTVKESNYIGNISRIVSYAGFTGYHNNSRWIHFAKAHPTWVQSIQHEMLTPTYRSFAHRVHNNETLSARFFGFADGLLVSDQAANIKGLLGRQPRPGYTEWQGNTGTLVHQAKWPTKALEFNELYPFANTQKSLDEDLGQTELRRCALNEDNAHADMSGLAEEYIHVTCEYNQDKIWSRIFAQGKHGLLEYSNTITLANQSSALLPADAVSVMEVMANFALAIRGVNKCEFTAEDARMSLMMEVAARESALHEGKRIKLPLEEATEVDEMEKQRLEKLFGIDPYDVESMLNVNYARP